MAILARRALIDEVRDLRDNLQQEILRLLRDFEHETSVTVEGVTVHTVGCAFGGSREITGVTVEVKL